MPKRPTIEELALKIGLNILSLRIDKGISQEKLADLIKKKQPSITRLENGNGY